MLSINPTLLGLFDSKSFAFNVTPLLHVRANVDPRLFNIQCSHLTSRPLHISCIPTPAILDLRNRTSAMHKLSSTRTVHRHANLRRHPRCLSDCSRELSCHQRDCLCDHEPCTDRYGSCAQHCDPQSLRSAFQDSHDHWRQSNSDHVQDRLYSLHTTFSSGAALDYAILQE